MRLYQPDIQRWSCQPTDQLIKSKGPDHDVTGLDGARTKARSAGALHRVSAGSLGYLRALNPLTPDATLPRVGCIKSLMGNRFAL